MPKETKYIITIGVIGLLAYNSVYFRTLSKVKAVAEEQKFDVSAFSKDLMKTKIDAVPAIEIESFLDGLETNFNALMDNNGKLLGVSNQRFFMVEGKGVVTKLEEEDVLLQIGDEGDRQVRIAIDFIFGNTLRDASGLVSVSDYASTMDFNNISVEMNNVVKEEVVPPFVEQVREGSEISFKGATKINSAERNINDFRVIPARLEIIEN